MKIIRELLKLTKKDKESALGIKVAILLAIALVGSAFHLGFDMIYRSKTYNIKEFGDFHSVINNIDNNTIKKISEYDRLEYFELTANIEPKEINTLTLKGPRYWSTDKNSIKEGTAPRDKNEIILSNKSAFDLDLSLGETMDIGDNTYTIVGIYDPRTYGIDAEAAMGYLEESDPRVAGASTVDVQLWFDSIRDTYTDTRELISILELDKKQMLEEGILEYNEPLLYNKFVFPDGILPSYQIFDRYFTPVIPSLLLMVVAIAIIFNAFNIWASRDTKTQALLRSVGMTKKQMRRYLLLKGLRVGTSPILIGNILGFILYNLIGVALWVNNYISWIEAGRGPRGKYSYLVNNLIKPHILAFLIMIALGYIAVYLSIYIPTIKISRRPIISSIKTTLPKRSRPKSKLSGNITKTLAGDYFLASRSSYSVLFVTMAIIGMVTMVSSNGMTRNFLDYNYNKYEPSYDMSVTVYRDNIDPKVSSAIDNLDIIAEKHLTISRYFRGKPEDNMDLYSKELKEAYNREDRLIDETIGINIIGLSDEDYMTVVEQEGIDAELGDFLLLNKIQRDYKDPYQRATFIPVVDESSGTFINKGFEDNDYYIEYKNVIKDKPFNLGKLSLDELEVYTTYDEIKKYLNETNTDDDYIYSIYRIKAKPGVSDGELSEQIINIISSAYSDYEYYYSTKTASEAYYKEGQRNLFALTGGGIIILLIIALINTHNSFVANLRARKQDFCLLKTAGMTSTQIEQMINYESTIMIRLLFVFYTLCFVAVTVGRVYFSTSHYTVTDYLKHTNYILILGLYIVIYLGIKGAIRSARSQ